MPEFSEVVKEERDMLAASVSEREIQKLSNLEDKRFAMEKKLWKELGDLEIQLDEETQKRIRRNVLSNMLAIYTRKHGPYNGYPSEWYRFGPRGERAMECPTPSEILEDIPYASDEELVTKLNHIVSLKRWAPAIDNHLGK